MLVGALSCMSVTVASAARWPPKHLSAAPVSPAKISVQLKQVTGYTASQLSATPACGAPQPGAFSCLAQVLTRAGTAARVGPRNVPHATPRETTTQGTLGAANAPVGATAPTAFTPAYLQ